MARHFASTSAALALALMVGCARDERPNLPPLRTVEHVDLERYLGNWYEIAAIPHRFEKGCVAASATYELRKDGKIRVINRCRKGSFDAPETIARGRARVVDEQTNAKLEVSFFGPFWGDYWIIELGENYEYAVVGHPTRDYLWILSRTPEMDEALYQDLISRIRDQGYDVSRIKRMPQKPGAQPAS